VKVVGDTELRELTNEMRMAEARRAAAAAAPKRAGSWDPTALLDEAGYGFGV